MDRVARGLCVQIKGDHFQRRQCSSEAIRLFFFCFKLRPGGKTWLEVVNPDFSAARVAIPLSLDLGSQAESEWAAGLNSSISASLDLWITSQGEVMGLVEFSTRKRLEREGGGV